jgi:hypothetical protein
MMFAIFDFHINMTKVGRSLLLNFLNLTTFICSLTSGNDHLYIATTCVRKIPSWALRVVVVHSFDCVRKKGGKSLNTFYYRRFLIFLFCGFSRLLLLLSIIKGFPASWGQFHQHFTRGFFVRKFRVEPFCACSKGLNFLFAQEHWRKWW